MDYDYKQLIIARKDLGMSPGKLAVQVSHASMAFLTAEIRDSAILLEGKPYYAIPSYENSWHPQLQKLLHEAREKRQEFVYCKIIRLSEEGSKGNIKEIIPVTKEEYEAGKKYCSELFFPRDMYEGWIEGSFTKVLCEAKNCEKLLAAVRYGEELGLVEGKDFFLIKDNCLTELTPEELSEDSPTGGRTLTCIGFRPLPTQIQREISRHYQLWRNPEKQEEREIAHWEWKQLENEDYEEGICSHCGEKITVFGSRPNYCPYCGWEMEETNVSS